MSRRHSTLARIALTVSCVATACSADDSAAPDGASDSTQPDGALTEAGLVQACEAPDASPMLPCGTLQFAKSGVLSRPRNHHVTLTSPLASGGWMLYAIAGGNGAFPIANVDRIAVAPDGTLGTWVPDKFYPTSTAGAAGEVVGSVIVVAGGTIPNGTGFSVTDSAYSSVIQSDGSLGSWTPAGSVGKHRMHASAVTQGNTIWILGGFEDPNVWSDIVSATVSSDGTVSSWQPAGNLPGPRSHFSVTVLDDYVYIAGGLAASAFTNPPDLKDVWLGQIQSDGTIGAWQELTSLPIGLATHASFAYGGNVYVCGGITDTPAESGACFQAPVQPDHTLGAFSTAASLPIARGHVHQLPVLAGHVYSIAGAVDFYLNSTTEIDIGTWGASATGPAVEPPAPPPPPAGLPQAVKCHAWK